MGSAWTFDDANPLGGEMNTFVENPVHFAADCACRGGRCRIDRENILFLDDGNELAAVDHLQMKCGHVVIVPDASDRGRAWLYHTSCDRMTDVVEQIFQDCLEAPASFPQPASEMSIGELQRRCVTLSYADCRAKVDGFGFQDASREQVSD